VVAQVRANDLCQTTQSHLVPEAAALTAWIQKSILQES